MSAGIFIMETPKIEIRFILPNSEIVSSPYDFGLYKTKDKFPYYTKLKILELNDSFCWFVDKIRKELKIIPEELLEKTLKPFIKRTKDDSYLLAYSDRELLKELFETSSIDVKVIIEKLRVEFGHKQFFKDMSIVNKLSLVEIILFGVIRVKKGQSSIYITREIEDKQGQINIHIVNRVKKNDLIKFVQENFYKDIQPFLERESVLPERDRLKISKRDFEIIRLRRFLNKPYKEIVNILDIDGESPEEACRQVYSKMKDISNT